MVVVVLFLAVVGFGVSALDDDYDDYGDDYHDVCGDEWMMMTVILDDGYADDEGGGVCWAVGLCMVC